MLKHAMNKQKGMTSIGMIFLIAIVGFDVLVAINIAPVYFTNSNITALWEKLESDTSLVGLGSKRIRQAVAKRLRVNNIYDLTREDIKIKRVEGYYIVTIEYEPRGKIVGSLDYIMTFQHEARIRIK